MKRIAGIALAALLAAGISQAVTYKISIYGGYGTAAGGALNDVIGNWETIGYETTEISSCIPLGLEIMRSINENLSVGMRAGYLMANEGSAKSSVSILPFVWTFENTYQATAIPVLAGIRYSMPAGDALAINAGLFAGLSSIALETTMTQKITMGETTLMDVSGEASDSATGLGAAVLVGATMKLGEKTELGLDVGYQMNSVDMEYADILGKPVKDTLDLGGVVATISLGILI